MKTNLLQKPLYYPNNMGGKQICFTGSNPLLKKQEKFDEVELEKNLDTKEGQIAFLQYHLEKAKGSQGFIARGFNKLKGWTGLGLSSKKLDEEMAAFMNDQVPFEKVCQDINKFKYNQKEATEILVDSITIGTSFATQCSGNKFGTLVSAASRPLGNVIRTSSGILIGASIMAKPLIKFIDSFGMKKSERKENRTFIKDALTGWTNAMGGAFIANQAGKGYGHFIASGLGVAAVTSGVRYLAIPKEDKSFEDFMSQQIENPALKIASFATLGAFGLVKCKKATKMQQATKNLVKSSELGVVTVATSDSQIKRIADETKLFKQADIQNILTSSQRSSTQDTVVETTMKNLEGRNIFIPKFLQTLSDDEDTLRNELKKIFGLADTAINEAHLIEIVQRFKSECTGARTQDEAQKILNDIFGDGKYTIIPKEDYMDKENVKPLGVGSVAETWKVQDSSGNKYAVKLLKEGITKEKIAKDKDDMLKILKNSDAKDKEFCEKSLNELYNVWEQELDLDAEMKNGEILGKNMSKARVAKGIEVKTKGNNTAYVMELAQGIQLSEYLEFEEIRNSMECSKYGATSMIFSPLVTKFEYMKVVFEQLLSVPQKGEKVMHADPHPGNIFINYEKGTNKPIFTFIDTGNVIKCSNKEALHNTIAHLNYFLGNTDAIAKTHLDGANLNGKNKEECIKELSSDLYESFYKHNKLSSENKIDIFSHIDASINEWMKKRGITPDPKLANLHKAETTYFSNSKVFDTIKKNMAALNFDNENSKGTLSKKQNAIKQNIKKLDKIDLLLQEPSKNECKKYDLILDTYITTLCLISKLEEDADEVLNNEIKTYCKDQLTLLNQKVSSLMNNLDTYIQKQFQGSDDTSTRYKNYSKICRKIFDYIQKNKEQTIKLQTYFVRRPPRESIYEELRDKSCATNDNIIFENYERLNDAYTKKQNATSKKATMQNVIDGGTDAISNFTDVALGIVQSITKDIMQHLPSSCNELIQLNKFIDEQPEKAMQGLRTTLG